MIPYSGDSNSGGFNTDGLLTFGQLKAMDIPDEAVITVCGTESILVRLEPRTVVNPVLLSFDAGDIEADESDNVLYRTPE